MQGLSTMGVFYNHTIFKEITVFLKFDLCRKFLCEKGHFPPKGQYTQWTYKKDLHSKCNPSFVNPQYHSVH